MDKRTWTGLKDTFRYWAVSTIDPDNNFIFSKTTENLVLSSASCPVRAARFYNATLLHPYLTGINSWNKCALQCAKGPSMSLPNNFNHQIYMTDLPVCTFYC